MCLYDGVSAQTRAFDAAGELLKVLAAPARLAIVMELADQHVAHIVADAVQHSKEEP
jgi:hypothetical protein